MSTGVGGCAHLAGSRLNLAYIWESSREELRTILGTSDTKKVIVWDELLISQVGLIADVHFLKELGVHKMVRLPTPQLTEEYKDLNEFYFFVRPQLRFVDQIMEAIRTSNRKQGKKFVVVFVPQKAQHCIMKFNEYGFTHEAKVPFQFYIQEFHLEMMALDQDVISLSLNSAFTDMYIDNDPTPIYHIARSICHLQALYGIIPKIYGKGKNAKTIADLMERMRVEMFGNSASARDIVPQIDAIVLLDRSVDLLTPLSTPLTYEGLIDEVFGIKHSCAKFPRQMFSEEVQNVPKNSPPPSGPMALVLNSEEQMFTEMRDLNFRAVGQFLSREAKKITALYEERHDAKTVSQLKQFVQKLPHMQQAKVSLSKHTTVAELIKNVTDKKSFLEQIYTEQQLREEDNADRPNEYIETCIGRSAPLAKILKLICMQSVANSGLKPRLLEYYKREVMQGYGYQHLISLQHLEKSGLIRQQEGKVFAAVRRNLGLVVSEIDELNPKDISYVFSGYAPLSIRLVEMLEKQNGFAKMEEVTRPLPGPAFYKEQQMLRGPEKRRRGTPERPRIVLVFFLGGVTYAEISALRFLSQREEATTDYIVGTTHILNGPSLINSVLSLTPNYRPTKLWENQLDDQGPPPPKARPQVGGAPPGPVRSRSGAMT